MANPAFRTAPTRAQGDDVERMTYEDTVVKAIGAFAVLLGGAAVGWFLTPLLIPAALIGFILAMVNIFKKRPSVPLILAYAAVEGVFVGALSHNFADRWDGVVVQAVLGTLGVIGVTLLLFLNGKVRSSPKMTKIFIVAMFGYLAYSLVNFGLVMFGVTDSVFGIGGQEVFGIPLGAIIGVFVVLLAAYSLVLDFEEIKAGVENGDERIWAWRAVFGLMVTVVWLYTEMLRFFGVLQD